MALNYFATTKTGRKRKGVEVFCETPEGAMRMAFEQDTAAKDCRVEDAYIDEYTGQLRGNGMNMRWYRRPLPDITEW